MTFLSKMKRAFGLPQNEPDDEDDDIDAIDATVTPYRRPQSETDASEANVAARQSHRASAAQPQSDMAREGSHASKPLSVPPSLNPNAAPQSEIAPAAPDYEPELPEEIFATVVEVFNEHIADFLRATLSPQAQRQYLYDALDKGMKAHVEQLHAAAEAAAEARHELQRQELQTRMEALREKIQKDEAQSSERQRQQLSVERQKRALSERVHDLEKQVAEMEAEKEQFLSERQELTNRVRLLQFTLDEKGQGSSTDAAAALEKANAATLQAREQNTVLQQQLEEAQFQLAQANDQLAQANDLNQKTQQELARATDKASEVAATDVALELANAQVAKLKTQLNEARANLKVVAEIQKQVETLEAGRDTQDARRKALEEQVATLRATIEENAKRSAQQQITYQAEIDRLRAQLAAKAIEPVATPTSKTKAPVDIPAYKAAKAMGTPAAPADGVKISAIDAALTDTDWLVATPPKGAKSKRRADDGAAEPDSDFGYHEPPRNQHTDNPAQMSLWDDL